MFDPRNLIFFADDFWYRFQVDGSAKKFGRLYVLIDNLPCDDEVDLANIIKGNFQMARSVALISWRANFEVEVRHRRGDVGQQLRIIEKEIDIVAFTMIDLQHHRCTTAKRPRRQQIVLSIDMIDDFVGLSEEIFPLGRACVLAQAIRATDWPDQP